jgi:hypothetical protein
MVASTNPLNPTDDPSRYYKMPPPGISECRTSIEGVTTVSYVVRCGAEDCWYVGRAPTSEDTQAMLNEHAVQSCPQPPHRNELPTGRSTLEKTWDELDEVTDALAEKREYYSSSGMMKGDALIGYARGIAFTLTMMTHPYFKTTKEISEEVRARRMMRIGKMEPRPTPGYQYNPMPRRDPSLGRTVPAAPTKPVAKQVPPKYPPIPEDKRAGILMALSTGTFSVAELATMFNYHASQIEALKE